MLESFRVFQLVATTRNFTQAARQAAMTRPAVSQHIKKLERHFNAQLLVRTTRRVELTAAGALLLNHVQRVLDEIARTERAMSEFHRLQATRLAVGASTLPGEHLLPAALIALRARHPDLDVRVRVGDTDAVVAWLRADEVQLGVVGRLVDDPTLQVRPFAEDEIVLVLPPGMDLPEAIEPEQLAVLPLVLREPGSATRATVLEALARHGLKEERLRVVAELGSPEAVKAAVRGGMGAAFLSRVCLQPGEARLVRIKGVTLRRPLCVCWRRDRPPGPAARALMRALEEQGSRRDASPPSPV